MKKFVLSIAISLLFTFETLGHVDHYAKYNYLEYELFRNNQSIGYHKYNFIREDDKLSIDSEVSFKITKLGVDLYNYFAKRLMYEEAPDIMPKDLYNEIHRGIAKRILSTNDEKWNTIPKAYNELDSLRAKYEEDGDEERLSITNDINNFLEEIEKKYQEA